MSEQKHIVADDQLWNAILDAKLNEGHLSLMNMNWWPTCSWDALTPYARIAGKVGGEFEPIRPLIDNVNWRINLYGAAIAVLADAKPLIPSLINQLYRSWAAPQLAAGAAILLSGVEHDARDVHLKKLLEIANQPSKDQEFKFAMSAYAVLRLCGKTYAAEFEETSDFLEKWRVGGKWYDLTKMHYERWRCVLPYLVRVAQGSQ